MILDPFLNIESFYSIEQLSEDIERLDSDFDGVFDAHFTDPHFVEGYYTEDGTFVDGYWRDGDGDTDTNLSKDEGGGYFSHDPGECSGIGECNILDSE